MNLVGRLSTTQRVWLRQFSRFVAVGCSGALVDFSVYVSLTRTFTFWQHHFVLASSLSSLLAATNNFFWNRRFTFAHTGRPLTRQYLQYLSITLCYLGAIQAGLWFFVSVFHLYDLLAKVLALGFAMLIYFTVLRRYIFAPARAS